MVKSTARNITFQALPVVLPSTVILFGAGSVLGSMEEDFEVLPGIIVMVPPLMALRGNISGSLASRLGSALHQGILRPKFVWNPEMRANVLSTIFLILLTAPALGFLAYSVSYIGFLGGGQPVAIYVFIAIALIASLLAGVAQVGFTILVAILSYARGWDPDNVTAPLVSTVGDLLTIACIFIAILLVG